jgi:2-keto-4-pentenoate hydratase/2-oxohepta-3-ene-1,7-dioic acid hydratase in catechol pathway
MRIATSVNGDVRQEGSTADLVFGVAELIAFISRVMTLLPGDVVLTGTPAGVGPVVAGDLMEVEIEGIGVLANPVAGAPAR